MARRRMFNLDVLDTDAFMDLPLSAQALYFNLALRADDDGFYDRPKRLIRDIGASMTDLEVLIRENFILAFDHGVVAVKHWRMHNLIKKDRYTPTKYSDEFRSLTVKSNGAYHAVDTLWDANGDTLETVWGESGDDLDTERDANVPNRTQNAPLGIGLGLGLINNNNICAAQLRKSGDAQGDCVTDDAQVDVFTDDAQSERKKIDAQVDAQDGFEEVWAEYPRKKDKGRAYKAYKARLNSGWSVEKLKTAVLRYAAECRREHTPDKYIKLGSTFFSSSTPFTDYLNRDTPGSDEDDLFLTG